MKKTILSAALAAVAVGAGAVNPLWVRDLALSTDGKTLAFEYKGSIYSVPSAGGEAKRLTDGSYYANHPVWSPDGRKIAYASSLNGGQDVYVMQADGANPLRLTFNSTAETPEAFTPDGNEVLFSAVIQDPASSALGISRVNSELYAVPAGGGRIRQVMAVPAVNVEVVPGSGKLVFEIVRGLEDKWRKHHTSSVTRDLWSWDGKTGSFANLTSRAGEDREPSPSADGKTLYFLSERNGGDMNVYSMPASGGDAKALTSFKGHPVRFLSAAPDLLAFTWNGEAYTMKPGGEPKKVSIDVTDTFTPMEENISFNSPDEASVSPDGTQLAFTKRGEVFVTSVKYPSTKQLTHTAAIEGELSWGADGRTLYYTSRRSGKPAIWKATVRRKEDPNFSNATIIDESPVFSDERVERSTPVVSPDGKKLAFSENRGILKVLDLASGKETTVVEYPTNYRTGGIDASWSPDGEWLLVEVMNPLHEPYSDVAIFNVATGERINITETAYFDEGAKWSPDGKAIIFGSDRYGMRSHASWGSQYDVMMVFLTKDAFDRYRLSEEDYALLKEVEKEQKKNDSPKTDGKKDDKKKGGKDGKDAKAETPKKEPMKIDREGLQERVLRLTPASATIADFALSKDGQTLYYLQSGEGGYDLWKKDLRKGDVSMARKGAGRGHIQTDKDGNMYLLGSAVKKIEGNGSTLTPVSVSGKVKVNLDAERAAMLDFVETEARERFYLPEMPIDWAAYVENYRRFLPHINNGNDFAQLLSELLGELNVSHSGGRYTMPSADEVTASLGLIFDLTATGKDGLLIGEVLEGGPFDRASSSVKAGDTVTAINGQPITASSDWTVLLNSAARKKTLVSFRSPSGKTWDETVLPITAGQESNLLYDRWVKSRAAEVDRLSGGRLGYVHIKSMDDESYRKVYSKLLGQYAGKEGIVIDTRWNGGGRLHEDIEVLFSGDKYLTQEIHGRTSSEMPSRRWNKPSIMVIGEANYSNAHGTPWVYKHKKLGKLIGMPVPGTMSSVNWIGLQNPSLLFGVPVVAFRTADGSVLENSQLEPDILVENLPADITAGRDAQIEVAVKTLLDDIDARSK